MGRFKVGDRVYHIRRGDPIARSGYARILEIEGTRAELAWEDGNSVNKVESRDLISEQEAEEEKLV
ncbi:MAG: hypothetical protein ACYCOR_12255 [Acidobacteriaceae bacterium]